MELKNIPSFSEFKEYKVLDESIDELISDRLILEYLPEDSFANKTKFSDSLLGRGVISLLKFLKRGADLAKLELYRRKYENELAMGVLRAYAYYVESSSGNTVSSSGQTSSGSTSTTTTAIVKQQNKKSKKGTKCGHILTKLRLPLYLTFYKPYTETYVDNIDDRIYKYSCGEIKSLLGKINKEINDSYGKLSNLNNIKAELRDEEKIEFDTELCKYRLLNNLFEYIDKVGHKKCEENDQEMIKLIQRHNELKKLIQHLKPKELEQGNYEIVKMGDNIVAKDGEGVIDVENGKVVKYNYRDNKLVKVGETDPENIKDIENASKFISILAKAATMKNYKLGIEETDVIKLINKMGDNALKDSGFVSSITYLWKVLKEVRKKNPDAYTPLFSFLKEKMKSARVTESTYYVYINEELYYNYNEWIVEEKIMSLKPNETKAGKAINSLIGFKKVLGDTTKLDWSLFNDKNVSNLISAFEKNKNLTALATKMVNKQAVSAIQHSVSSAIYHTQSPVSNKLFPSAGGGITDRETYLARIWKKMVNNVKARYKFFLHTEEVDPYKLAKNISVSNDDISNVKNKVENEVKSAEIVKHFGSTKENKPLSRVFIAYTEKGKYLIGLNNGNTTSILNKYINIDINNGKISTKEEGDISDKFGPKIIFETGDISDRIDNNKIYLGDATNASSLPPDISIKIEYIINVTENESDLKNYTNKIK